MSIKAGTIAIELSLDDDKMVVGIKQAGDALKTFQRTLDTTSQSVRRLEQVQTSLGTRFRNIVLTMGNLRFVLMDLNDIFLRLPISILGTAGELERLQVLMKGLSKETNEAARTAEGLKNFNYVIDLAKTAPFGVNALADSFVKLKTAGLDPTTGAMQSLIDSVARFGGSDENLKRASVAIQQMSGKGVISMEELRQQLGEAVPSAMQAMADGVGVSMAELTKIISTGTLQATAPLEKMFLQLRIENDGAAAAMVQTWTGQLNLLKTEWALTAKFIADNGFGDAAKESVKKIVELLRSEDFKKFAADLGQGLASVTRGLTGLVEGFVKYRTEIGLVIQAFIAYKVATSILQPIASGFAGITGAIANQRRAIIDTTAATKATIQATLDSSLAKARESQVAIAGHQAELASLRKKNAEIIAQDAALAKTKIQGKGLDAIKALQAQEAALHAQRQALGQANTANLAAQAVAQKALTAAELEGVAAARAATVARSQMTAATVGATVATAAATGASKLLSAAYLFMGGPVGALIIAVGALVYWWNKSAEAATLSAAVQKRALEGTSVESDKEILALQKAAAQRKVLLAQKEVDSPLVGQNRNRGGVKKTPEQIAKDQKALQAAQSELLVADTAFQKTVELSKESNSKKEIEGIIQRDERSREALRAANRLKILEIQKIRQEQLKDTTIGKDQLKKRNDELLKQERDQLLAGLKEQLAFEDKGIANIVAKGNKASLVEQGILLDRQAARQKIVDDIAGINRTIESKITLNDTKGPKKEKADKSEDKVGKLIADLAEQRAKLQAEINSLDGASASADTVAGKIALVRAKFKNGDLDGKDKEGKTTKPKQAQINESVRSVEANAILERTLADKTRITAAIEQLQPQLDNALELINNPETTEKIGKNELAFRKMLATLKSSDAEIAELFKAKGTTLQDALGGAVLVDISSAFKEASDKTREINAQIVEDTRTSEEAKVRYARAAHLQRLQILIDRRRAEGASTDELLRLTKIQFDLGQAYAAKVAEAAKTPAQKIQAQWEEATRNMQEASARWGQQTIDVFVEATKTGKLEFGKLAESILSDILRIQLQKNIGGAVNAGIAGALSYFGFADGGIMSSQGSLPLKKYAAGGIANSPQMAIFGEGDMNEAYVPLPDGRSIPVTMKGGAASAAPTVIVNVINQSGNQVGAKQGQPRFDGKQMILDVVLSAAGQPGGFRDGMKGALR